MANPPFNDALGVSAMARQAKPPMRFEGVTLRMFPLRANMFRLRKFIDSYLNIAEDVAFFRPAMPSVFLMVLDYGKMSAEVANFGWVSQREVAFAVPLEWYDTRGGTARFVDFASVCPFIYVDDETSLSTGRQVYGWPKVRVWANEETNPWLYDPRSSQHLLELSTMVFPELYAGKRQQPRVFLEVRREAAPSFSFPPSPDRLSSPLSIFPTALQEYMGMFGAAVQMTTNAPLLGYPARSLADPLTTMMRMGTSGLSALTRTPTANNITLKQFRDAEKPESVCFQALVNSNISTERFNRGGMLGETNLMLGDPTGGFRIIVHHYAAQPVVELLGIEVAEELEIDGARAHVLRPTFPFWSDVDMEYGVGHPICWRTRESAWHVGSPDPEPDGNEGCGNTGGETKAEEEPPRNPYNTARSGALQAIGGPFYFPNVTLRVLPLLADPERLKKFIAKYLENDDGCTFEAWGSYVYLVATSYEEMTSETNDIGWWADRELTFFVPVRQKDSGGKPVSMGIVPAFSFVNTTRAAIIGNEVKGQPTIRAILDSPADAWMNESGPSDGTDQALLSCSTSIFPALNVGQRAEMRKIVAIHRMDALPYNDDIRWRMVAFDWGRALLEDHQRKVEKKEECKDSYHVARALALELLANGEPFNIISLKQFRDSKDPERACFQSIIRTRRRIEDIYDIREIEDRLHVCMYQEPSLPIVEILGLKRKWTQATGEAPVDILQPVRPFWAKLSLREDLGEDLRWRSGSETWRAGHLEDCQTVGYFKQKPDRTNVGPELLQIVENPLEGESSLYWRQRLKLAAREWTSEDVTPGAQDAAASLRVNEILRDKNAVPHSAVRGSGAKPERRYTRAQAAKAVEKIEPQLVLEAILSAEWMHWGNPRRIRKAEIKRDLCVRSDSVGMSRDEIFEGWKEGKGDRRWSLDGQWYSEDKPTAPPEPPPADPTAPSPDDSASTGP